MRSRQRPQRLQRRVVDLPREARVAVISDTHSLPHPALVEYLGTLGPHLVLHAGDIGDEACLEPIRAVAPLVPVRGNIDGRAHPDDVHLVLRRDDEFLAVLLTHVALRRARLLPRVRDLATRLGTSLVVCGHSHVPFIGRDGEHVVFNPGSCGPRRWSLPITLGVLELGASGAGLRHVDCETGLDWSPP